MVEIFMIKQLMILKKYDEVRKIATVQGDGYTAGCFSDHQHFKDHFQLLANYLSKQE